MEESIVSISEPQTPVTQPKKGKMPFNNGYVVGLFLFLVICLLGVLAYYVLKDNGINLFSDTTKTTTSVDTNTTADTTCVTNTDTENITVTEPAQKMGTFKVNFAFPGEGTPAVRLCFTNTEEISEQYCFWKKGSRDTTNYSNDLEKGQSTLPIGTYSVDYTVYQDDKDAYQIYSLRQCVYYADGGENNAANVAKYCSSIDSLFKDYITKLGGGAMPDQLLNSSEYGGNLVIFTIKENQTTDLGTISLSPYI